MDIMKRIVLFRCHKLPDIVRSRVTLLRRLNPTTTIHCLYGGPEESFGHFIDDTGDVWDSTYCIRGRLDRWKWLHSDLAVLDWYNDCGTSIPFDMLHLIEWDLLPTESLEALYRHIPIDGIGLTGLTPLSEIIDKWVFWTELHGSWWPDQLTQMYDYAQKKYGDTGTRMACQGPAPCFPRRFIDTYANNPLPDFCHDEVRLPLAAQCLGFSIHDTGFFRKWFNEEEFKLFNCTEQSIETGVILSELQDKKGRRMFHPVREVVKEIENIRLSPTVLI